MKKRPRIRNVSPKTDRTVDGILFASKKEAARFKRHKLAVKAGRVAWFLRQPSYDLPGGVRYRGDFLVAYPAKNYAKKIYNSRDEEIFELRALISRAVIVEHEDVKGYRTEAYKLKKRQVEAIYPIRITEV